MSSLRAVRFALAATTAWVAVGAIAALASGPALAQPRPAASAPAQVERIAAVVNDEVVSASDVAARVRLGLVSSGLPDTAEARQRLTPQVMRQLVDERLQMQEAKRIGVSISDKEVEEAMDRIAQQNNLTRDQLLRALAQANVPRSTLAEQLRVGIAWQRVLQRRVRQEVVIGDEEIDAALERLKEDIGKPEYLTAEIFLGVDQPEQDEEVRRLAERLADDIRRGGNFAAVARQFSQSAGAANGGDIGWVRQGELRPELDQALRDMRPGMMSRPIRTAEGWHILAMRAQRTIGSSAPPQTAPPPRPVAQRAAPRPDLAKARVNMAQIVVPAAEQTDAARKAAKDRAEALRKGIRGCADFLERAKATGLPENGDMGTLRVRDLPKPLQQLVLGLEVGQPSPVLSGPGGALVLIVCKRDVPMIEPPPAPEPVAAPPPPPPKAETLALPSRDEMERELVNERAELLSRRYLRDLRRAAFIEFRS